MGLYNSQAEDRYVFSNSGGTNCMGCGFPDTITGQLLNPYTKNTEIFTTPMDTWKEDRRVKDHLASDPCSPRDTKQNCELYAKMVRSNIGYNYAFFSPWRYFGGKGSSVPVSEANVAQPANTLMMASSIWDRVRRTGEPSGGGNWVIETPCFQDINGKYLEPMAQYAPKAKGGDGTLWMYDGGWKPPTAIPGGSAWLVYGGMWPFHNQVPLPHVQAGLMDGHVIVMMADTSVKSMPVRKTTEGCNPYDGGSDKAKVDIPDKFIWDLN